MVWWPFGKKWPEVPMDEIRKRARIVVVDDAEFPYLPLFLKDGYTVEKWDDIQEMSKLESGYYDLILLDIQGVAKDRSEEQGLSVLKHVRSVNPAQIIMAYSNADWSLKYQEFFRLADATLAKSADYYEFKRSVDRLLKDRFSLGFYVDRIVRLAGERFEDDQTLRKLARDAILRRSTDKLESYLKKASEHADVFALIVKTAKVAITLLGSLL